MSKETNKNLTKQKLTERAAAMAVKSTSGLVYEPLPTTDPAILSIDDLLEV